MYFDYLTVLVFLSVGFIFVFANILIGSLLRPRRKTEVGLEIYECGEPALGSSWIKFDLRYYTVALVYVIFAVEIAFLFPWAIVLTDSFANEGAAAGSQIGIFALVEGVIFIAILFLGLAYVWAKGDLDWTTFHEGEKFNPAAPTEGDRRMEPISEEAQPKPETADDDEVAA